MVDLFMQVVYTSVYMYHSKYVIKIKQLLYIIHTFIETVFVFLWIINS